MPSCKWLTVNSLSGPALPLDNSWVALEAQAGNDFVQVFEGEGAMTKNNHKLGQFLLSGIKPAAHGVPSNMVTFEVDFNDNLKVTADEKGTGNMC